MMKKYLQIILFLLLANSLFAQKTIYIPNDFNQRGNNYCNVNGLNGVIKSIDDMRDENEKFSKTRSLQTENIICFWEKGFGTDPAKMINPANTGSTFNLNTFLANGETIFNYHYKVLKATHQDGKNISKYKYIFLLYYTNDWMAYGGGYDYTIGAMWLNPAALGVGASGDNAYRVLAHELFHSMSYQAYSDRLDNQHDAFQNKLNGPFWERSANFAATQMYPNNDNDFARWEFSTHTHFLSSRKHYTTSFEMESLRDTKGVAAFGNLWTENKPGEHPLMTARRLFFDNDMKKLNDFIGQTAMKNITWDYATGTNAAYIKSFTNGLNYNTDATGSVNPWNIIMKKHRTILRSVDYSKRHFAVQDCQAPQDFGFNAIRIYPETTNPDGSATIKMRFRGHTAGDATKNAGWRWGFVAIQQNGTPRYGTLYADSDKTVTFTKNATDTQVWLIVTGAPTAFNSNHQYNWEAGFPKYYRYPYEVRFQNAIPMGYEPDFEGAKTNGKAHSNGGGWVANTATVAATAYVGPNAKVLGSAKVSGNVRVEDFAVVKGSATISDNAVVKENAFVFSNAIVAGNAVIAGCARVLSGSNVSGDAFVTDNAFIINTTISGNAIACGNLWQRDVNCTLGGTTVAGGDNEYAGNTDLGSETSGTYLQWPEQPNNQRTRRDGKGNLTTAQLATLKSNWNNLSTRFSILNNSISTSTTNNPNYDINYPYSYFITDTEMSFDIVPSFTLNIKVVGTGTVSSTGGLFEQGTPQTLTATPGVGFMFSGWSGDATGTTNPLTVTMSGNKTITANFTAIPVETITYNIEMSPMTDYTPSSVPLNSARLSQIFGLTTSQISSGFGTTIKYYGINSDGTLDSVSTANAPGHWFNKTGGITAYGDQPYLYSELDMSKLVANVGQYPGKVMDGESYTFKQALVYTKSQSEKKQVTLIFNVSIKAVITGIEESAGEVKGRISPNPSNESFNIELSRPSTIDVYTLDGKLLNTYKNVSSATFGAELKAGIYLVKVGNTFYKIVKE